MTIFVRSYERLELIVCPFTVYDIFIFKLSFLRFRNGRKIIKQATRDQVFLVYEENSQAVLYLGSKVLFPCPVSEVSSVQRRKMVEKKKTEQDLSILASHHIWHTITSNKGIKIFHLVYKKRYSPVPIQCQGQKLLLWRTLCLSVSV